MPDTLLNYFNLRFERNKIVQKTSPGPFITISRQTGCNASLVAKELVKRLCAKDNNWKYINKEILEESAGKLKLAQSRIRYVFESENKTHVDEVLSALSNRYYKSDKIVRKTILEVLRHFANTGKVIIVGRAGVIATDKIKNGLHVRLVAPFDWRIESVKRKRNCSTAEATDFIRHHDTRRLKLIEEFGGTPFGEINFDLTLNCAFFSVSETVSLLLKILEFKKAI